MTEGVVFRNTNYPLSNLIEMVDSGAIGLPDLQRPFVWSNTQVRDLMDSLYKGLPAGLVILWQIGESGESKPIGLDKATSPNRLVIDGQQRLTCLFSIIKGKEILDKDFNKIRHKISFNPIEEKFEVWNFTIAKNPEWIEDIFEIFSQNIFDYVDNYFARLKEKKKVTSEEESFIKTNITKLNKITSYPFSVLELSSELDPEDVSEIFVRINSKGKVLNQSDFILTLMSIYWNEGRKELEKFSEDAKTPSTGENSSFNIIAIKPTPENLLRSIVGYSFLRGRLKYAYLILKGRNLQNQITTADERDKNFEIFKEGQKIALNLTNWQDFIKIIQSIGFVNENLISSKTTFYATYSLYLLGKYKFNIENKKLEQIISRWFVFCLLTQRYTQSPESFIEQDLVHFRTSNDFVEILDKIIKSNLTEDFWNITLPQRFVSSISNNVDKVYYANKCHNGKNLLFSKIKLRDHLNPLIKAPKKSVEQHHIFPKKYLVKQGLTKKEYNQRANIIYIGYKENIEISDNPPEVYWEKMLNKLDEFEKDKLENHYTEYHDLPQNFWKMNYDDFLEKRRELMAKSIKEYFMKL